MTQWVTTTQLIEELRITDNTSAWTHFCSHFQPVIVRFARRLGLSSVDAEDAAQETMTVFFEAFNEGKYDPKKGRLSSWLFGVANRVILNMLKHRPLEHTMADETTGTSFWEMIKDDQSIRQTWETEWRQMVLKKCLDQARHEFETHVVKAFELYGLNNAPLEQVCRELDMSKNAVYIAKSRVLARVRELAQEFDPLQ